MQFKLALELGSPSFHLSVVISYQPNEKENLIDFMQNIMLKLTRFALEILYALCIQRLILFPHKVQEILIYLLVRFLVWRYLISGKDKTVVLWSIQDHIMASATDPTTNNSTAPGGSIIKQTSDEASDGTKIGPRGIYVGHEDTVEDVAFCPSRYVGYMFCLFFWIWSLNHEN